MTELRIEKQFKQLLRPLTNEEFEGLEKGILKDGVLDPIIVWAGMIVDGHHRYEIARKHNIDFKTESIGFKHAGEARQWIIERQAFRRNQSKEELTLLIGREYNAIKKKHGGDRKSEQHTEGISELAGKADVQNASEDGENIKSSFDDLKSSQQLSEKYDVGSRTVERYGKIAEVVDELPEDDRKAYLNGTKDEKAAVKEKIRSRLWTNKMTEQDRKDERDVQMSKFESDLMSNDIPNADKTLIRKLNKGEVVSIRIPKYHHTLIFVQINNLWKQLKLS